MKIFGLIKRNLFGFAVAALFSVPFTGVGLSKIYKICRPAGNALRVHSLLQRKPVVSAATAATELNLTAPTVRSAIENLETLGLVRETTGKRRDRLFVYTRYLDILQEDTDKSFSIS